MFLTRLTLSLLYVRVSLPTVHARALVPPRITAGSPDPQVATYQSTSWKPPQPWNEHRCQSRGIDPDVFLTFSWGAPITESRIVHTLYRCREHLVDGIERLHLGGRPLPFANVDLAIDNDYGVKVNLRFYRTLVRREVVTWNQALAAVNLVEFCGVRTRNYDEMWAYIFGGGKQIGYITMEWDPDPEPDSFFNVELGNGTSNILSS